MSRTERPPGPPELSAAQVLDVLARGDMELVGLLPRASNYTFGAVVRADGVELPAVYKPQGGETPLWDFPDGTLWQREVAAYVLSETLGFGFVPPTIARDGPHGTGSVQLFVDAEPGEHYLSLMPEHAAVFARIAAFDIVANNADRKSGHCLLERGARRIWVVDHGVCFHDQPKLRTVIWDFAAEPLPPEVRAALDALDTEPLRKWLAPREVDAVRARAAALLQLGRFPDPPEDRRSFPWPPV